MAGLDKGENIFWELLLSVIYGFLIGFAVSFLLSEILSVFNS